MLDQLGAWVVAVGVVVGKVTRVGSAVVGVSVGAGVSVGWGVGDSVGRVIRVGCACVGVSVGTGVAVGAVVGVTISVGPMMGVAVALGEGVALIVTVGLGAAVVNCAEGVRVGQGVAVQVAGSAGRYSFCPTRMVSLLRQLTRRIRSTVVLVRSAKPYSVSPPRTE